MAVHARSDAATMAMPGAAIQAFWLPVTTMSQPQAPISNGTAPRPETLSTRISASGAAWRIAAVSSATGCITPVVAGRPEIRLHAGLDPGQDRREVRAAVVDHLSSADLADARRQAGWARDSQVGLEARHGCLRRSGRGTGDASMVAREPSRCHT